MKLNKMIGIIERCGNNYKNHMLEQYGLGSSNYIYLITICKKEGLTQEDLVKEIYVNKSNVARTLKYLESEEYIYKKIDEDDKRSNRIYPTTKAYQVLDIIKKMLSDWKEILLNGISIDEQEKLELLLEKIVTNATGHFNKTYIGDIDA